MSITQVPSSPTSRGSPPLLRKGVPGEKKPLREKLITYYEEIFQVKTLRFDMEDMSGKRVPCMCACLVFCTRYNSAQLEDMLYSNKLTTCS